MRDRGSGTRVEERKTPWHLWAVAILALLWNAAGAYTIMMAQAGRLADLKPEEAVYYAAQPIWFVIATDISLLAAIAGAVALLLRSRTAVWLFALSLVSILVTNVYDLAAGTSRTLANQTAAMVTVGIVAIAILELAYARAMKKRGVLT
jgi:hypothetical protein